MTQFRERLSKLVQNTGLTIGQLAKLLDIGEVAVEGLMNGYTSPNESVLKRIAQIFNVSLAYIAMLTDDPKCEEDPMAKEVYVVDRVSGVNGEVLHRDIVSTVYMNAEEMHGKEFLAVVVQDNSMERCRIQKGDTVMIKRQKSAPEGSIVYCVVEGEALLRRYNRVGNVVLLTAEGAKVDRPVIKIDTTETKFVIIGVLKEIRINL